MSQLKHSFVTTMGDSYSTVFLLLIVMSAKGELLIKFQKCEYNVANLNG